MGSLRHNSVAMVLPHPSTSKLVLGERVFLPTFEIGAGAPRFYTFDQSDSDEDYVTWEFQTTGGGGAMTVEGAWTNYAN